MIYGRFLGALALTAYFVGPAVAANEVANFRGSGNDRKGFSKIAGSTGTAASAVASSTASASSSSGGSSSGGSSNANQLNPANVQSGSDSTGLTSSGSEAGQSASAT